MKTLDLTYQFGEGILCLVKTSENYILINLVKITNKNDFLAVQTALFTFSCNLAEAAFLLTYLKIMARPLPFAIHFSCSGGGFFYIIIITEDV